MATREETTGRGSQRFEVILKILIKYLVSDTSQEYSDNISLLIASGILESSPCTLDVFLLNSFEKETEHASVAKVLKPFFFFNIGFFLNIVYDPYSEVCHLFKLDPHRDMSWAEKLKPLYT